jgi:hypothetical protein
MSFDYAPEIADEFRTEIATTVRGRRGKLQQFRSDAGEYYADLLSTLVKKQADYGPTNISLAPGGPINGLLVRMNDKMQRLINLTYSGSTLEPENEAIRDSYADLANYCVIALMVLDGKWEGVEGGDQ